MRVRRAGVSFTAMAVIVVTVRVVVVDVVNTVAIVIDMPMVSILVLMSVAFMDYRLVTEICVAVSIMSSEMYIGMFLFRHLIPPFCSEPA